MAFLATSLSALSGSSYWQMPNIHGLCRHFCTVFPLPAGLLTGKVGSCELVARKVTCKRLITSIPPRRTPTCKPTGQALGHVQDHHLPIADCPSLQQPCYISSFQSNVFQRWNGIQPRPRHHFRRPVCMTFPTLRNKSPVWNIHTESLLGT